MVNPVIAVVDHKSLTYMRTSVSYMILDWLNFLQRFDLRVVHRPGLKHILPDSLSHLYKFAPSPENENSEEPHVTANDIPTFPNPPGDMEELNEEFVNAAVADAEWIYSFGDDWETPPSSSIHYGDIENAFLAEAGVSIDATLREALQISRRFGAGELGKQDPGNDEERIKIVKDAHTNGPHDSAYKLQQRLYFSLGFYWPKMYQMCRDVCESCKECVKFNVGKTGFHFAKANPVTSVNDTWGWDILSISPQSKGYAYILLVVDFASRKCWLTPLKSKEQGVIARAFYELGCRFGFPLFLQSDKDPSFCNAVLHALKHLTRTGSKWSAPFCPWTNPVVENQAKSTKELLRKILNGRYKDWYLVVPIIEHYLNQRIIESTKSCADTFYFGRVARDQHEKLEEKVESFESLQKRIDEFQETVFPAMAAAITDHALKRAAKLNASRVLAKTLQPGNRVMMKVQEKDDKSHERWEGPYMIVKKANKGYTTMNNLNQVRSFDVPRECLKRVRDREDKKGGWWEVLKIMEHKELEDGTFEYLTLFDGYDDPYWIHESDFNSKNIISTYWKRVGSIEKKKQPVEKRKPFAQSPSIPSTSSSKSRSSSSQKPKASKNTPTTNLCRSKRH